MGCREHASFQNNSVNTAISDTFRCSYHTTKKSANRKKDNCRMQYLNEKQNSICTCYNPENR